MHEEPREQNPYRPTQAVVDDPREIEWDDLAANLRTTQVIVAALVLGLVAFGVLAIGKPNAFNLSVESLTLVGLVFAAIAIPMSILVPRLAIRAQTENLLKRDDSPATAETYQQLGGVFQTQLIFGCALLEAPGFLNLIAFQSQRSLFSLLACGVCLALLVLRFPTKWKLQNWISNELAGQR